MNIIMVESSYKQTMEPIICGRTLADCPTGGTTLKSVLLKRLEQLNDIKFLELLIRDDFWPSAELLETIYTLNSSFIIENKQGDLLMRGFTDEKALERIEIDKESFIMTHPWELLRVNSDVLSTKKKYEIKGTIRTGATVDGELSLGAGSLILPGVYIEGFVVIGENCKIGPNCYIRGNTSIGNNCHIGQAVEIKNSIFMDNVNAGHLSYIGDSIIGFGTNLGAGTITANFRHDGKNHVSASLGVLVDTGLRKFGTVLGDDVHTGIHTSIFPGRKIWPHKFTLPGDVVKKDIKSKK